MGVGGVGEWSVVGATPADILAMIGLG
jgi:hypothetical protein